jgi:FkbM family methyltransferase
MVKLRGIDLALHDPFDDLSGAINRNGDFWESNILDYIRDTHPVHKTIVDIGANIGNHSVYFASFLEYESILAIEPIKENFELLRVNMAPFDNIGLAAFAVSDHTGYVRMKYHGSNFGAHYITDDGEREIPSFTLDRIGLHSVTLLKIDAEWHEPQILEGASETLIRCRPLILIEDAQGEYASLLPQYEVERAWEEHSTFLYRWKDD